VPVSTNQGTPLMLDNPTHPVSRAIRELAEANLHVSAPDNEASSIPEARQRKKTFTLRWGR
jgi:MinD-like ATPase involved in chromosome partitioning or flagellar assembly